MSMIVHAREGGGYCIVHVDILKKPNGILAIQRNIYVTNYEFISLFLHESFYRKRYCFCSFDTKNSVSGESLSKKQQACL